MPRAGSPPRMRGKHGKKQEAGNYYRITPADAGKTCFPAPLDFRRPDHPRGCGENFDCAPVRSSIAGSPPRMRGKPARE